MQQLGFDVCGIVEVDVKNSSSMQLLLRLLLDPSVVVAVDASNCTCNGCPLSVDDARNEATDGWLSSRNSRPPDMVSVFTHWDSIGTNKLDVLTLSNLSNEESWRLINLQRCDKSRMTKPMSSGHRADRRRCSKEQSTHTKMRTMKSNKKEPLPSQRCS